MAVVRISLGRFDADRYETVRRLLDQSRETLVPAIRALRGNRAYYVGVDRETNAMTNVSVWETRDDAEQMATLGAMLDWAKTFAETGVRFERPITNHETLWML
jgi:quinol monooxygenase YgiN